MRDEEPVCVSWWMTKISPILFSYPCLLLSWHCPFQCIGKCQVQVKKWLCQKTKQKRNKRTIIHFSVLVGGKSRCYIFCFSMEGSCASAHTLAHELIFPVKWVRVPQEGRFMYFRTVCQHLWKKVQCPVLMHTYSKQSHTANKQQNSSLGDSRIRHLSLQWRGWYTIVSVWD